MNGLSLGTSRPYAKQKQREKMFHQTIGSIKPVGVKSVGGAELRFVNEYDGSGFQSYSFVGVRIELVPFGLHPGLKIFSGLCSKDDSPGETLQPRFIFFCPDGGLPVRKPVYRVTRKQKTIPQVGNGFLSFLNLNEVYCSPMGHGVPLRFRSQLLYQTINKLAVRTRP